MQRIRPNAYADTWTKIGLMTLWDLVFKIVFDNPPATLKRKNKNIFECGCPPELNPVCMWFGWKSYSSSCMATCNGTTILKNETCPTKGDIHGISEAGSYSAPFFMTEAQQEALGGGNVGLESITEEEYQASVQNALTAYTAQGQRQSEITTPSIPQLSRAIKPQINPFQLLWRNVIWR